jgi:hypothetical protein
MMFELLLNHRIGAHTCTNHTVPYGTTLCGGAVPGTLCQATIAPSLRDISQQALASPPGNQADVVPVPAINRRAYVPPGRVLAGALGHDPGFLSAFVERSDLLTPKKS